MRKKVEATIANRRRISDFFGRVREVYERKFDGFPAKPADASGHNVDGTDDPDAVNVDDIADAINDAIQKGTDETGSNIPTCPDDNDCYGDCDEPTPSTFIGAFPPKDRWVFNSVSSTWTHSTGSPALLFDYDSERDFQTFWIVSPDPDVGYVAPHNRKWEIGISSPGLHHVDGVSMSWELIQGNWGASQPANSDPGGTVVATGVITAPVGINSFQYYQDFDTDIPVTPVGSDNLVQLYLKVTGSTGAAPTDRLGIYRDLLPNSTGGESSDVSDFVGIFDNPVPVICPPCSGKTIIADGVRVSETVYATRVQARYVVSVTIDGIEQIPSVDWTFSDSTVIFSSPVDINAVVLIRFVAS